MAETRMMRADEIVNGFNSATDHKYWRASVAGTRVNPEVHFNSRATMVRVAFRIATEDFTITFSKSSATFGDFLASAYRAVTQILAGLEAAGLPFQRADDFGNLRIEYNARSKDVIVSVALPGAPWANAEPMGFKVPERFISGNPLNPLDEE